MKFNEWSDSVPEAITNDPLWETEIYRKALFLSDLVWRDCETMLEYELGRPLAWQLIRSAGSISANMEEGYGRGFGKDYARFLRIALGSAGETRGWYYRGRRLLREEVIDHRLQLIQEIVSGLVILANQQSAR